MVIKIFFANLTKKDNLDDNWFWLNKSKKLGSVKWISLIKTWLNLIGQQKWVEITTQIILNKKSGQIFENLNKSKLFFYLQIESFQPQAVETVLLFSFVHFNGSIYI